MPQVPNISGTDGPDDLTGNAYGDVIFAFGGDDVVHGLGGTDFIYGQNGNDTLYGGEDGDYFYGGAGNDVMYGEAGSDYFEDGDGIDQMFGGDGNDAFIVSSDDGDTYDGGAGEDSLYLNLQLISPAGVTVDLSAMWSGGLGYVGTSTLRNMEAIPYTFGSEGDDHITIGAGYTASFYFDAEGGNDTVNGGSGDDSINGEGGDDRIFGWRGDDYLGGSTGNDLIVGGLGNDFLVGGGDDDILRGGEGDDRFLSEFGFDRVFGDAGNDYAMVYGGRVIFDGGIGDDTLMMGGLLAGSAVGGDGTDTLIISLYSSQTTTGATLNLTDFWTTGAGRVGSFVFSGFETLAPYLYGTLYADRVTLGTPSDKMLTFDALNGDDLVIGGDGVEQFLGGSGNDDLRGLGGNDELRGQDGDDTLIGGLGDDELEGGNGNDSLVGGDGDDLMKGGSDNDSLVAGVGNDRMNGGKGLDELLGGAGDDSLFGADDADILRGGAGRDFLHGGAGADSFSFASADFFGPLTGNVDVIADFNQTEGDLIDLSSIDAITGGVDDSFTFIGTAAFGNVAGQLRYSIVPGATYPNTRIEGDRDGDGNADLVIIVRFEQVLAEADFVL